MPVHVLTCSRRGGARSREDCRRAPRAKRSSSVGVDELNQLNEKRNLRQVGSPRYKTAGPSLSARWRSFRRKQRVTSTSAGDLQHVDLDAGVGDLDDDKAIVLDESPPSEDYGFFESLDGRLDDELCVRICKDTIRGNLMELMRTLSGSGTPAVRLEDLEAGRVSPDSVAKVSLAEANHGASAFGVQTFKGGAKCLDLDPIRLCPQVLAGRGPTERSVALLWACFLGRADLARAILDAGADLHYAEPSDGLGALHLAAFSGSVELTKLMLAKGIDVNKVHRAFAPLQCAMFGNAVETARVLLRAGATLSPAAGHAPAHRPSLAKQTSATTVPLAALTVPLAVPLGAPLDNGVPMTPVVGSSRAPTPSEPGPGPRDSECPLHCAVRAGAGAGAADCVQLLLEVGADPDCVEAGGGGWTPLHIAADRGAVRAVRLLLDAGAALGAATWERGLTPLHVAAEAGWAEVVSLLLERGADPAALTARRQTPLHLAARAQSVDCVETLLREARSDPNAADVDQRTPLHSAVGKAIVAYDMVEMLINARADVNARDRYGYTPLHVAALNELSTCVETLLYHGADVSARTRGGTPALSIIARKTPASLAMLGQRLDAAISMHDPEVSHREVELKLDFRPILQHCHQDETSFLKTFVDEEGQKHFLQHPLCQAFLHLKWQKVRKVYAFRIAMWGVFTVLLTLYILTALAHDCYNEARNVTLTPDFCLNNSMIGTFLRANPTVIEVEWYILVILTSIEMLRKTIWMSAYTSPYQYLSQSDNLIEWPVLASVFAVSFIYSGKTYVWQNHLGAFSVLFAWINLMVMIGQLPVFGTYVAMYVRVQTEVAKLLLAYACLLIGFTITFCVMFPATQTFSNPFVGFIKVLVMMTGELEFEDLLSVGGASNNPTLLLTVSAHLTFVMFLLSVTIVLMNLMVGIAVHDIQGLKKTAILSKLVRQTNLISYIERALFKGYLPKHVQKLLCRSVLVSPSGYRVVLHVKPLNPREVRLPKPVLDAAYEVAKQRRKGKHTISSYGSHRTMWQGMNAGAQSHINQLTQEVRELREAMRELLINLNPDNEFLTIH
ncbi:Transient receptor potential channel pyrexia [Frankliniella fusca]|uniref:Transient receptor potential channel pyrexia n=1 Tax=Frankliniella fusca TaxID=407009 RepID=A0AAE1HDR5_9NEOP|nr:Transient receptor potential channel pyrexia [Frankliniella fusca]